MGNIANRSAVFTPLDLQSIKVEQRADLEIRIDQTLRAQFGSWLPKQWATLYSLNGFIQPNDQDQAQILKLFDEFLFHSAVTLGPRLFLSQLVLKRMFEWNERCDDGVSKLQEMFKAITLGAKVRRGQASAPIKHPSNYTIRKHLTEELKALQGRLRAIQSASHRIVNWDQIESVLCEEGGAAFHYLNQALASFKHFAHVNPELIARFASGDETAPALTNEWMGWGNNQDPEYTRQVISRLGNKKA